MIVVDSGTNLPDLTPPVMGRFLAHARALFDIQAARLIVVGPTG